MKLNKGLLILAAAFALGLSACNNSTAPESAESASESEFVPVSESQSSETSSTSGDASSQDSGSQDTSSEEQSSEDQSSQDQSSEDSSSEEAEVDILFGEEATKGADTWVYWADNNWCGSTVSVVSAKLKGGVVTAQYTVDAGNCDFGFQLFYKNSQLITGASYQLTMKVNSQVAANHNFRVNGTYVDIAAGDNTVKVKYLEGAAAASSIAVIAGTSMGSNTLVLSDIAWDGILDAPSGVAINNSVITFNAVDGAAKYLVEYRDANTNALVDSEEVAASGATLTKVASLAEGNYAVTVTAMSSIDRDHDSMPSQSINLKIGDDVPVPAAGPKTAMGFGENGKNALPLDTFVYWNDQNWCGSNTTVTEAYTEEGTVHATYESTGTCGFSFQIFYYNSTLTTGQKYRLTFKVNSEKAVTALVHDNKEVELVAGDNTVTDEFVHPAAKNASLCISFPAVSNTVTLSNFSWEVVA